MRRDRKVGGGSSLIKTLLEPPPTLRLGPRARNEEGSYLKEGDLKVGVGKKYN